VPNLLPEQEARQKIDPQLEAAGWAVQDLKSTNLGVPGRSANLGNVAANTFFKDQHPDLKADDIMAIS
jgi:type I site-specific restriction endonuclease